MKLLDWKYSMYENELILSKSKLKMKNKMFLHEVLFLRKLILTFKKLTSNFQI